MIAPERPWADVVSLRETPRRTVRVGRVAVTLPSDLVSLGAPCSASLPRVTQTEHEMPLALQAVGAVPLDLDGAGLRILADFQPFAETEAWFSELESRDGVSARDFLVFAVDEDEGYDYAAIWLARPGAELSQTNP
jgi:hypothetical protein